ncbi:Guanine nucleotide-binding protein subunit beta-2-like 1 [Hondaea fermentalgiana]|uniref:Guanine nucleotide-binding protein subunit beta-2-like 1 n=1 Tax=Hondaea fermentalgiana TaxID=2315210 RepID=A0A2R5GV84_9STRA|nr:Guanine nucleotide-binding protein subunit beta-2-like 1 [Hondaea fermentalgiana]|eukprot:GBG34757.1 Guanine nucleotide-binding protein subunit beta-2-like 1 [Hondaea fermentalgiana]
MNREAKGRSSLARETVGRVKSLIALFNSGRVGKSYAEAEVYEVARAEAELQTAASEQREAYLEVPKVIDDLTVLVVHDPTDETVAEQLVDAIQPRLSLPVRIASHVAETEQEAKNAEVALLLVSMAFQDNWELIEAVAKVLPNSLVPILIDEAMVNPKEWKGALAWYISDDLLIDYCKPAMDATNEVMTEALAAKGRVADPPCYRSFHAFLSHELGKNKWVHKMAIELALRLRDHDIDVWLDAQEVSGSIHKSVAGGIDSSTVFLVFATEGYMQRINNGDKTDDCLKEFVYASNKRFNQTVVAALESDMARPATMWTGRFKLALARQVPVDLSQNMGETFSDKAIKRLANAIRTRIETPLASSGLTPLQRNFYSRIGPYDSEVWARGKAESFTAGTRSWIIDELCDWYKMEQSAVFLLVGDGGIGKSVIIAELCHRGGALMTDEDVKKSQADESTVLRRKSSRVRSLWRRSKKERQPILVAAYHFFRHDDGTAASPTEALLSVAWQLCKTVPGFPEALDQASFKGLRETSLAGLFKTLLADPLNKLGSDQMRQVVVLDALDESSNSDGILRDIIRTWEKLMPAWLRLVVGMRPEGGIQRGITNNSLDFKVLELNDEENFRDIELYIENLLRDKRDIVEQKDVASCAKILVERSEGLFLWASFLPETLERMHEGKKGGLLTLQDISHEDAIPNGLGGMFHEYFGRLQDKVGGETVYKMLLAPIVAAREPLSVEQLSVILQLHEDEMYDMLDDARCLLFRGGDGRVALIHKRMADWLSDRKQSGRRLCVKKEDGHEALAKYCSSHEDAFSLRHAIFHSVKSGDQAGAFKLLNDFAWVKKVISIGDDEGQRRATIGNLIRDCVKLGIYFARESDTPLFLSKTVHALSYDPNELASQVLARLGHNAEDPIALDLQAPDRPWLEPICVTLPHPRDPLLHELKGHSGTVRSVAIQGEIIVSGSYDNTVRIWSAASGEEQHLLNGHSGPVYSVAIQDDAIVSGSEDKTVRIWNATVGEEQHVFEGHTDRVYSVAIDGNTIVSGSRDKTVRIWNATSGEEEHVLKGHSDWVRSVAIQGATVVSGSDDKTVRIWDATSGEEAHVLTGHSDWVRSVAIEGETIVSGSDDNTVRIWNATSGEEQHVLKGHSDSVTSVAIEGDIIVSQSNDETRYWNARTGEEVDAEEAEASIPPGTSTLANVENGTHLKLAGGIGFTTNRNINGKVRQGNVYVLGDASGMVHILHAQSIESET